jgi:cytosine/adenosine deaminase-related metal-dependent hydrolase
MGLEEEVGTIEVNKRADLILLAANPLDNIHYIRTVRYVVANGVITVSASSHIGCRRVPPSSVWRYAASLARSAVICRSAYFLGGGQRQ